MESIIERGIVLRLEGGDVNGRSVVFVALVEQLGNAADDFEVATEQRNMSRLHVLNVSGPDLKPDLQLGLVEYGSVLVEAVAGRRHRVLTREPRDIKTIFNCRVDEAAPRKAGAVQGAGKAGGTPAVRGREGGNEPGK